MKREDQVCSYKQSKKLVELGVVLDTTMFLYEPNKVLSYRDNYIFPTTAPELGFYPAPNVAELGMLLEYTNYTVQRIRGLQDLYVLREVYGKKDKAMQIYPCHETTEAQARAESLIWLLENGYIKAGDLKQ